MKAHTLGFSLVEVLIALAVLSLGLLGSAAMLLGSLHAHTESLRHSAATALLRDMAERIRMNPGGLSFYVAPAAAIESACAGTGCDVAQLAAADLSHFARAAAAALPGENRASVEYAPATGPAAPAVLVISLRWQDPRADDAEALSLRVMAPPVAG